jgi:hypothetical protein
MSLGLGEQVVGHNATTQEDQKRTTDSFRQENRAESHDGSLSDTVPGVSLGVPYMDANYVFVFRLG